MPTLSPVGRLVRVILDGGAELLTAAEAEELAASVLWCDVGETDGGAVLSVKPWTVKEGCPCVVIHSNGRGAGAGQLAAFAAGIEAAVSAARSWRPPETGWQKRKARRQHQLEAVG